MSKKGKTLKEKINGVRLIRASSFGIFFSMPVSLSFISYLRKMLKKVDVLQCHMPFPLGDLAYFLSGYQGKLVVWWHSDVIRQKKLMFFYKPIMNAFLKKADTIIVATQGHIDGSKYLTPFKEKCRIVPYGIKYEEMINGAIDKNFLNTSNQSIIKLLFIGRLVYYKGINVLIDAIKNVNNVELYIIGTGTLQNELENQIKNLDLSRRIHILGDLKDNEVKACLRDCDIFVLPSIANSEAFGIVQLEAMAYGKPVINTDLPTGVPYVSINGKTGLTVKPNDVEALSEAIQLLVDNKELREKMGKEGIDRVKKYFNQETMLQNILEIYTEE